jgi:hypothetical protein
MHTSEGAGDYGGDVLGLCSLYIMTRMVNGDVLGLFSFYIRPLLRLRR